MDWEDRGNGRTAGGTLWVAPRVGLVRAVHRAGPAGGPALELELTLATDG